MTASSISLAGVSDSFSSLADMRKAFNDRRDTQSTVTVDSDGISRSTKETQTSLTATVFFDNYSGRTNDSSRQSAKAVGAKKNNENLQHMELIVYLSKILDTLSHNKIKDLAEELQDRFEIFCAPDDLLFVELEDLESLETLRFAQKMKFLQHVQRIQENGRWGQREMRTMDETF